MYWYGCLLFWGCLLVLLVCGVYLWVLVWVFVANCRCCRVFGLRGVGLLLFDLFVVYFDLTLGVTGCVYLFVGWCWQLVCADCLCLVCSLCLAGCLRAVVGIGWDIKNG